MSNDIIMTRQDRLGNARQVEVIRDPHDGQWVASIYSSLTARPREVLAIGADWENPEWAANAAIDAFNRRRQ